MHKKETLNLKELRKISYGKIQNFSAVVVNEPIGKLSKHDLARIVYVFASSTVKMREEYDMLLLKYTELQQKYKEVISSSEKV